VKWFNGKIPDLVSTLSYLLGKYHGLGLYNNYPDNFNNLIPEFAKELEQSILSQMVEVDALKLYFIMKDWDRLEEKPLLEDYLKSKLGGK